MNQYDYYLKCHTIHSSGQVEYFKNFVENKSIKVGDKQDILTNDNHMTPVSIKNGLLYIPLCTCTDQ